MAILSYVEYDNTGGSLTQSSFSTSPIGSEYLLKSHVKVYYGRDIVAETHTDLLVDRAGGSPGAGKHYEWTNATTIRLIDASGNAQNLASGKKLTIIRDTPDSSQLVPWTDGSNLNAEALNNADKQNLYVVQEQQDKNALTAAKSIAAKAASDTATSNVATLTSTQFKVDGSAAMTGDLNVGNNKIKNLADPTAAQDAVTKAYLERTGSITSTQILDGTIANVDISASAGVSVSKLAAGPARQLLQANAAGSAVEWTSSIDLPGTLDVTGATVLDGTLNVAGVTALTGNTTFGGSITVNGGSALGNATVATLTVTGTVDGRDIAADGAKLDGIEPTATADQTAAEIRTLVEAASDSNVFTDADHTKLNGIDTGAKDDQTAAEIKTLIASSPLDASHLAPNSVTTSEIADAELTVLAGMQGGTASKLAEAQTLTADINDLNQIDGLTKQAGTSLSDTDTSFPTSKAVVNYVAGVVNAVGGFVSITGPTNFPSTQPNQGVVVSIQDVGSGFTTSSNEITITNGAGSGNNVKITNFPASYAAATLTDDTGLQVTSDKTNSTSGTPNVHVYKYHKQLAKESDVKQLSDDINEFNERYRVENTLPAANSSSNHDGDLVWAKDVSKMYVYSGDYTTPGSFGEVQSIGNFYISTLSPAFNGTLRDFTLANAPSSAEQVLLSVNGVIQRPMAGTTYPAEGFALSGSTIKFSAAPANGADYFAIVIGSTVNIGTPSNNTVSNAILQSGCVDNAKVATNAAIAGTKIDPDFGNQAVIVGDGSTTTNVYIKSGASNSSVLNFGDSADPNIGKVYYYNNDNSLRFTTNAVDDRVVIDSAGKVGIGTTSPGAALDFGVTSTGDNVIHLRKNSNSIIGLGIGSNYGLRVFAPSDQSSGNVLFETGNISTSDGTTFAQKGLAVLSDGKVGIGETSPEEQLHITHATAPGIQLEATSGGPYKSLIKMAGNDTEIRGSSGNVEIYTGNDDGDSSTERLRIDSSGRVIQGNTSALYTWGIRPKHQQHGTTWDDSSITLANWGNNTNTAALMFLKSKSGTVGTYSTAPATGEVVGRILWFPDDTTDSSNPCAAIEAVIEGSVAANDTPGSLVFKTTADGGVSCNEKFRINNNGNCKVTDGDLHIGTAGHGINFQETSDAGGMTSELLDDYEEGTFDGKFITNSGTFPTQTVVGHYVKIGKHVTVHCQITFSGSAGSGAGMAWIELPFTLCNARGGMGIGLVSGVEWSADHQLFLVPEISSQACYLVETEPNAAGHAHLGPANFKNSASQLFSYGGTYIAA